MGPGFSSDPASDGPGQSRWNITAASRRSKKSKTSELDEVLKLSKETAENAKALWEKTTHDNAAEFLKHGFTMMGAKADGNCLFHAYRSISDDVRSVDELRAATCAIIDEQWNDLKTVVEGRHASKDAYLKHYSKPGTHCDDRVLEGLSVLTGRCFRVFELHPDNEGNTSMA